MQSFSFLLAFAQAFLSRIVHFIIRCVELEVAAQAPFFKAWQEDTNLARKFAMPEIYVCYLLPQRLIGALPYPFFAGAVLTVLPLYWRTLPCFPWYGTVYCMFLYVGLAESLIFGLVYFYVPGGKDMWEHLLYGDANLRIFMGHPGKAQVSSLKAFGGTIFAVLGFYGIDIFNAHAREYAAIVDARVAMENAQAELQNVQPAFEAYNHATNVGAAKIKALQDLGTPVSTEQALEIMRDAHKEIAGGNGTFVKNHLPHGETNVEGSKSK